MLRASIILASILLLSACNISDRLSRVGVPPDMNEVNIYEPEQPSYDPTHSYDANMEGTAKVAKTSNSLWKPGARTFFRDQRARSVGDILKVVVTISDQAKLDNKTSTSRNDSTDLGISALGGLELQAGKFLPGEYVPDNIIDLQSVDKNNGAGKIDRKEDINTTVAATVIKILPSNNLVIKGSQEVRINNEVREVTVEGIVRPEDISAQNSITLDQIAEARVSYGGRGNISDYQQPRYGKQVLDIITPF